MTPGAFTIQRAAVIGAGTMGRDIVMSLASAGLDRALTDALLDRVRENPEEIGAASVDFLQYSAYVLLAGFWLQAAARAQDALEAGSTEQGFYQAKLHSARFYVRRVLPRASGHREALLGGADCLMALADEHFAF